RLRRGASGGGAGCREQLLHVRAAAAAARRRARAGADLGDRREAVATDRRLYLAHRDRVAGADRRRRVAADGLWRRTPRREQVLGHLVARAQQLRQPPRRAGVADEYAANEAVAVEHEPAVDATAGVAQD